MSKYSTISFLLLFIPFFVFAGEPDGQKSIYTLGVEYITIVRPKILFPAPGINIERFKIFKINDDSYKYNYRYIGLSFPVRPDKCDYYISLDIGTSLFRIYKKYLLPESREKFDFFPVLSLTTNYIYIKGERSVGFIPSVNLQISKSEGEARNFFSISIGYGYEAYYFLNDSFNPHFFKLKVCFNSNILRRKDSLDHLIKIKILK